MKKAPETLAITVKLGATLYGVTVTVAETSKPRTGVTMKK